MNIVRYIIYFIKLLKTERIDILSPFYIFYTEVRYIADTYIKVNEFAPLIEYCVYEYTILSQGSYLR